MIPGHIADAASRGDLETIRAYFEDDSDGARDVDNGVVWNVLSFWRATK